ncbi:MAG: cadherin-like domain-containing protein, partial [Rhodoferax sp.]|nr:cadherin-like domain-containing protein [Rhodoferax sp.]
IQLRGQDSDGDALSYGVQDLPFGASFDEATGRFSWTPARNQAGNHDMVFSVTDGHGSSQESVRIVVADNNQLPVFVPMIPQLARENAEIAFTVVAADPDADPILLQAVSGMPEGALFVPKTGNFSWTPSFEQAGDHVIRFVAVDPSGIAVEYDVTIKVANVNRAPVLQESDH